MAYVKVLRTYRFIDKDPVIDELRTVVQDEGLMKRLRVVADLSSLSYATIESWFGGSTKRPQNASVMAVLTSLGYERRIVKARKLDVEKELEFARAWLKRERAKAKAKSAVPKTRRRRRAA